MHLYFYNKGARLKSQGVGLGLSCEPFHWLYLSWLQLKMWNGLRLDKGMCKIGCSQNDYLISLTSSDEAKDGSLWNLFWNHAWYHSMVVATLHCVVVDSTTHHCGREASYGTWLQGRRFPLSTVRFRSNLSCWPASCQSLLSSILCK